MTLALRQHKVIWMSPPEKRQFDAEQGRNVLGKIESLSIFCPDRGRKYLCRHHLDGKQKPAPMQDDPEPNSIIYPLSAS